MTHPGVGKSESNNRYPSLKNRAEDLKQLLFFVGGKFSLPPDKQIQAFDHEVYFQNRVTQWINHWNQVIRDSEAGG